MGDSSIYNNSVIPIAARQGAGMVQYSKDEIMIVGGFNGKFLPDYYTFKVDTKTGSFSGGQKFDRQNAGQNLFPFQVPTVGDSAARQVISIDWSQMALY